MISLIRPGVSPLHRMPAGPKLLVLIAAIAGISIIGSDPFEALAALAAISGAYSFAFGLAGLRLFAQQLWQLKWLLLVIIIPQLIFGALWQSVLANVIRLAAAMLAATLFTFTTKSADLIASIEHTLGPFKRFGLKPEIFSLTIAMTINAIPMILKFSAQAKEAQTARGVKPRVTLMAVPLLVASLKYADEFAEALTARGVEI